MSVRGTIPTAGVIAHRPAEESISVIDRHSMVDGALSTSQDLRIEGRVDGSLRCDGVLHVAQGAEIDAEVDAAAIIVEGTLSGVVQCRGRLEVRSTGVVRADIETIRLVVHEGGQVEGRVIMHSPTSEVATDTPVSSPPPETAPRVDDARTTTPAGSPFARGFPSARSEAPTDPGDLPGSAGEEDEPES